MIVEGIPEEIEVTAVETLEGPREIKAKRKQLINGKGVSKNSSLKSSFLKIGRNRKHL